MSLMGEIKMINKVNIFLTYKNNKKMFSLSETLCLNFTYLSTLSLFCSLHRRFARLLRYFTRFWKDALRLRWKSYLSFYSSLKEKFPA